MTDQIHDDPDYKVGYKKPPKETRFPKGVSGNPRGRRPKIEPSRTTLQQQLDILEIAEQSLIITVNGKSKRVSGYQAVLLKLWQKAVGGDPRSITLFLSIAKQSVIDFSEENPQITGMVKNLHSARIMQPTLLDPDALRHLNKFHKQTRGS